MIFVPRIRAQTFIKKMSQGRTQPGLYSCHIGEDQYQEYVVKYHSQLGSSIICEYIAALLGHHLGLPVPSIAIVEINVELIAVTSHISSLHTKDRGPHFGSEHKGGGYMSFPDAFSIQQDLIPIAIDIFAFDMLIQNPDRSHRLDQGKPNLLFNGSEFVIFDHEFAFSFLGIIGPPPPAWELRNEEWVKSHIFYRQLARYADKHTISFDNFINRFQSVSDVILNEIVQTIPVNWNDSAQVSKIVDHLVTVRENLMLFRRGLLEVFA